MIIIKGAGDIASGIAVRLFRAGYSLAMTDLAEPSAIRRTVAFSEAIRLGSTTVEHISAVKATDIDAFNKAVSDGIIPVVPINCGLLPVISPACEAIIDARLAKINIDTSIDEAKVVIGIGPGFTAGIDCHAVVETQRGHYLGRSYYQGSAAPNTGIPGNIGGYGEERVLRSPDEGVFMSVKKIGDSVNAGDTVATVNGVPMKARIPGMIRGLLPDGFYAFKGMKSGDVDPRSIAEYCDCVSDKALAIAGGVLEVLLRYNVFPKCIADH